MKLQHTCDPPSPTPARHQDEEDIKNNNEDDVVYELRVINACVQNDDVVLPRRPQVALLAPFYQYAWHSALDTIEPHAIESRVTDSAQNGKGSSSKEDIVVVRSSNTIKKPTYRRHHSFSGKRRIRQKRTAQGNNTTSMSSTMNRSGTFMTSNSSSGGKWQAHIPLTAAQWLEHTPHIILGRHSTLPHNYRLPHDCVSRLHARVVYINNKFAHDYFTRTYPLVQTQQNNKDKDDEAGNRNCEEASSTQTAIEHTTSIEEQGSNSNGSVSRRKGFSTPYYLLINHSENMTYVNTQGIPCGRSCILSEGDVVSVLECAYDIDGGILDRCADPAAAQAKTSSNSKTECVEAQKDEEQEEEEDALVWCTQHAVRPERFTQLQTQVQATLTAVTCGHEQPTAMDIDEVVKEEEDDNKKEEEQDTLHKGIVSAIDSVSSATGGAGVVEVHGRVIARRRPLEVHSSVKEYLQHYKQNSTLDVKSDILWPGVAWLQADEHERLLQQLLIHAAEEENDADVLSPLNGLLRLNVCALRRALLQRKQQQQQQQAVKEEEEREVYVIGQRLTLREASVSIIDVDALDEESNEGRRSVTSAAVSDELESSPLKQLIAELQLNASRGTTPNGKDIKAEDANTKQVNEAHLPLIFPLNEDEGIDASSALEQIPTACDFITLQPALLPVYVFTRQSTNSPSRYTCERRTMRPLHSTTNDDPQQPAYIYYYYEDKENNNTPEKGKEEKEEDAARSVEEVGGWSILRPKDKTTATTKDRDDNVNRPQDDEQQQQHVQRWRTSSSSAGSSLLHSSSLFSPSAIPRGTVVAETASYKRIRSNTTNTLVSTITTAANGTGCLVIDEPSPIDHTTCTSNNNNEDDACTTLSDLEAAVWIDETSGAHNVKGGALHKGGRLRRRHHRRHRWK